MSASSLPVFLELFPTATPPSEDLVEELFALSAKSAEDYSAYHLQLDNPGMMLMLLANQVSGRYDMLDPLVLKEMATAVAFFSVAHRLDNETFRAPHGKAAIDIPSFILMEVVTQPEVLAAALIYFDLAPFPEDVVEFLRDNIALLRRLLRYLSDHAPGVHRLFLARLLDNQSGLKFSFLKTLLKEAYRHHYLDLIVHLMHPIAVGEEGEDDSGERVTYDDDSVSDERLKQARQYVSEHDELGAAIYMALDQLNYQDLNYIINKFFPAEEGLRHAGPLGDGCWGAMAVLSPTHQAFPTIITPRSTLENLKPDLTKVWTLSYLELDWLIQEGRLTPEALVDAFYQNFDGRISYGAFLCCYREPLLREMFHSRDFWQRLVMMEGDVAPLIIITLLKYRRDIPVSLQDFYTHADERAVISVCCQEVLTPLEVNRNQVLSWRKEAGTSIELIRSMRW